MFKKLLSVIFVIAISGCSSQQTPKPIDSLSAVGKLELQYAEQFEADYLTDGCVLISINESERFLVVPDGQEPPANVPADITVLRRPIENIYLAATSAMCLFDALDALGHIAMSGTKAEGWYIENARAAMESGAIVYAGKYSAPDYETLMAKDCGLAIESTMIYHTPEVKEKLEELGIPVLVERSSYEPHPLGRTEWIKLYGLLCGKEDLATRLFDDQAAYLDGIAAGNTGKTVAFFYINSTGGVVARKSGDYAVKMIELAGGNYVFSGLGDSATGSVNLEMEQFYAGAKDAGVIIYNSSIDGEVRTLDELLAKSRLLADFNAVKNGDVWCTSKNLFQETTEFGLMISELNRLLKEESDDLTQLKFYSRLW
ncbi:MAG: ABC transporter substrate-binding protein [Clostridiales bacterium]|jgi:iron complex transport system substrate-binding protein|nr:ABC transporter substrate-binding protein [Clostridiales bacterium]